MLNFVLTSGPSRLSVRRVGPRVFRFAVACKNVANVLVIGGDLCLGSSVLRLHGNLPDAERAAGSVEDASTTPEVAIKAHLPETHVVMRGGSNSSELSRHGPPVCTVNCPTVVLPAPEISADTLGTAPPSDAILSARQTACRDGTTCDAHSALHPTLIAPHPPRQTYKQALLSPPKPAKTLGKRPHPPSLPPPAASAALQPTTK